MSHSLIPIRVDAWSADKATRIVDTFLLDPTCWPAPTSSRNSNDPSVLVEANTQYLADTLLLDAEVMGMGRQVAAADNKQQQQQTFTGRLALWNFSLQQRLCDQIREQLWRVLVTTTGPLRDFPRQHQRLSPRPAASDLSLQSQQQKPALQEHQSGQAGEAPGKRLADATNDEDPPTKRMKTDPGPVADIKTQTAQNLVVAANSSLPLAKTAQPMATLDHAAAKSLLPSPSSESIHRRVIVPISSSRDSIYSSKMPLGNLIPIRIRLTAFGVRIHDDFYVDPVLDTSPIIIAQSIAKDLNLNDDLIVALTVDIAEQLHGMTTNQEPILPAYDKEQGAATSTDRKQITAAYKLDHRVHITNVAHLVHDYRA